MNGIFWHPKYDYYGITSDGAPVSAKRGDPRPLAIGDDGRVHLTVSGRCLSLPLRRFAAECLRADRPGFPRDERALAVARSLSDAGRVVSLAAIAREMGEDWKTVRACVARLRAADRWPYCSRPAVDPNGRAFIDGRLARFRAACAAKRERTGCGRLTLDELTALFPDSPVGPALAARNRRAAS